MDGGSRCEVDELHADRLVFSQVMLCANSKPALNDVTYSELVLLVERAAAVCPVLAKAVDESSLWVMDSGQASPCLDLG